MPGLRPAAAPPARGFRWPSLLRHLYENGGLILGMVGIALLWGGVIHFLSVERRHAIESATNSAENLTRAFEEQIIRTIKSIDQSLLFARESYRRNPAEFDIGDWTRRSGALTDLTFQMSLVGRTGRMRGSNLLPDGSGIDLSDREHVRVHADRPDADALFISGPVLGRASHKWSVQLTRKLMAADGSYDGVIVISLDPLYLTRFYDSVDLGKLGIVALVGTDGVVRASADGGQSDPAGAGELPGRGDFIIGGAVAPTELMDAAAKAPAGSYTTGRGSDGVHRLLAYRQVRGYRLLVVVGLGVDEILAAHQANKASYVAVASVLSALILAITVLVVLRQGRLRRAREQLRASEAGYLQKSRMLQTTLEHMSQGIMMVAADRRVQVCNHRAIEKLGLPPELMAREPLFDDVLEWQWRHGEFGADGQSVDSALRDFVRAGGVSDQAHVYERSRPNGRVLEIRSTPLPDGGVVRTYTDITARKETEAVLLAARDAARDAARVKTEFLAMMSHEIRSPMTGLIGVLDMLSETPLDDEQRRMARMVHGSAHSLLGVLNDILDFSKIEAGALSIVREPVSVRALVHDVVQLHAVQAARKDIALDVRFGDGLDGEVELDPLRVRQILTNLLSNALKFTPSGRVDVDIGIEAEGGATRLRFDVRDTGIGMTADVLARLFNPFVQADGSTSRDYGGTGLGLSICKRLAELLDGSVAVRSAPGEGSTFTLHLPWIPVHRAEAVPPVAPAWAGSLEGRGRILVADDDATNRWLTQRQMQMMGLEVDVAEDGETALAMWCDGGYDVLLTDCHMPHMDGVGLTRAVRALPDPALAGRPVIGLTADVTAAQHARCMEAGMTELAHKPMDRQRLAVLMARHLPSAPAMPDAAAGPATGPGLAVFDTGQYTDLFDRHDASGGAWLQQYLHEAAASLTTLSAVAQQPGAGGTDRHLVADTAHRWRGASLAVGAARLAAALAALERAGLGGPPQVIAGCYAAVRAEHAASGRAIAAFIAELNREAAALS